MTAINSTVTKPTAGVNGTYNNIPIDTTNGSGVGLDVNLTVTNNGANLSDWVLTIAESGYNYAALDTLAIDPDTG